MKIDTDYTRPRVAHRYPSIVATVLMLGLLNGCQPPDRKQPGATAQNSSPAPIAATGEKPKVVVTNTIRLVAILTFTN
jgi:hypothetical protein